MSRSSGARWLWLAAAVVAADRATKFAVERYTGPFLRKPVLSDFVVLVHNQNPGIAFGVFSESNSPWLVPLLLLTSLAVIALLMWTLITGRAGGRLADCGLALILGGAAGNAFDRIIHGRVTDFLEVGLGSYRWPAFNVADAAITIGAVLIIMELFFVRRHKIDSAEYKRG